MKLIFDSVDELRGFLDFAEQLGAGLARHEANNRGPYLDVALVASGVTADDLARADRASGWPPRTAIAAQADTRQEDGTPEYAAPAEAPEVDRDGVRYDERIHAPSRAIKAGGTWRMKRGVSQELVDTVLAEQHEQNRAIVQAAQTEEPKAEEPAEDALVTETHALPTDDLDAANTAAVADQLAADDPEAAAEVASVSADTAATEAVRDFMPAGISIDFPSLVADAQALAGDLSGDMVNVLNVSREFLAATSHETFATLKAHVAPDGDGQGKALPTMTPGERRLLEAAMTLYLKAHTE